LISTDLQVNEMSTKKKALVTGGAGFIGSHLADRLIGGGYDVLVADDLSNGLEENVNPAARFERIDISEEAFEGLIESWKPGLIFHLAAQANVRRSAEDPLYDTRVNVLGTLRVLEGSRRAGVKKVVFASTGGAVYGEPEKIPCDESTPRQPLCLYGANKLVSEHYLEVYRISYGLGSTILRLANIYGPRQNPKGEAGVVAIFSQQMLRGEKPTIFGDGSKTRDYVFVSEVVDAFVSAAGAMDGKVYNIGLGKEITDQQVFDAVATACGSSGKPIYGEVRPGEVIHISLDASLIRRELGWNPRVSFEEGVALTVPFYRKKLGLS
jgi:UDP-glucose 4-epimerase